MKRQARAAPGNLYGTRSPDFRFGSPLKGLFAPIPTPTLPLQGRGEIKNITC